ncbi:MAG TPA: FixH family protein [Gammaproteobacteria bacterium]|nr:FixH family protein [Gammaproteobacteria bacterium]
MTTLLIDLFIGIAAILAVFFALYRLSPLGAKQSAAATALAVIGIYVPYAILRWPGADVFSIHLAIYLVTTYILGVITSQRDHRRGTGKWFHWAPAVIVLFFATIVSIDSVLIVIAQKGVGPEVTQWLLPKPRYAEGPGVHSFFPGTVPHDYQNRADDYNEYLVQVKKQRERGWQLHNGWIGTPRVGSPEIYRLTVNDRNGQPVTGASVKGTFMRPSNVKMDRPFTMEEIDRGVYQVSMSLPEPGIWDLILEVRRGEDLHELRGTTTVKPADQS